MTALGLGLIVLSVLLFISILNNSWEPTFAKLKDIWTQ